MHCEFYDFEVIDRCEEVLILVLVEDALREDLFIVMQKSMTDVLILVLVEDALRAPS